MQCPTCWYPCSHVNILTLFVPSSSLLCLQVQMQRMLLAAALPLLTNLELQVEGVDLELYPLPLPDVYCGHPLLVAGKYTGTWPETATISGTLATGEGETCSG